MSRIRQVSPNAEGKDCFCMDVIVNGTQPGDLILGCGCYIHSNCLVSYIHSQMDDKAALLNSLKNVVVTSSNDSYCIQCPFSIAKQCQSPNDSSELSSNLNYLSVDDLNYIVDLSKELFLLSSDKLNPDDVETLSSSDVIKLQNWLKEEKNKNVLDCKIGDIVTDGYIKSTTKPCPKCAVPGSHFHGHNCHHISPYGGCSNCHTHYCYRCLSTEAENILDRGNRSSCKCGFWSNYCSSFHTAAEAKQFLVMVPYPYDKRCGCAICPDCQVGKPCPNCPGDCVVCLGYVPPGPRELSKEVAIAITWNGLTNSVPVYIRLLEACRFLDYETVKTILEREQALLVIFQDNLGRIALHYICDGPKHNNRIEILKLLLPVMLDDINSVDFAGNTPMTYACHHGCTEVVSLLLANGADGDIANKQGLTPLIEAVFNNHIECILVLLGDCCHSYTQPESVAVMSTDSSAQPPQPSASNANDNNNNNRNTNNSNINAISVQTNKSYNSNTIKSYNSNTNNSNNSNTNNTNNSNNININIKTKYGTALSQAIQYGYTEIAHLLIQKGAKLGMRIGNTRETLLMIAVQNNQYEIAKLLLNSHESNHINTVDIHGQSALHRAVIVGHTAILTDLLLPHIELDLNHKDMSYGDTALMKAVKLNRVKIASLLLKRGADIQVKDHSGNTAMKAVRSDDMKILLTQHVTQQHLLSSSSSSAQNNVKMVKHSDRLYSNKSSATSSSSSSTSNKNRQMPLTQTLSSTMNIEVLKISTSLNNQQNKHQLQDNIIIIPVCASDEIAQLQKDEMEIMLAIYPDEVSFIRTPPLHAGDVTGCCRINLGLPTFSWYSQLAIIFDMTSEYPEKSSPKIQLFRENLSLSELPKTVIDTLIRVSDNVVMNSVGMPIMLSCTQALNDWISSVEACQIWKTINDDNESLFSLDNDQNSFNQQSYPCYYNYNKNNNNNHFNNNHDNTDQDGQEHITSAYERSLGRKILLNRVSNNWTQAELAAKLFCTKADIQGYESGCVLPSATTLKRMKRLFG